MKTDDAHKLWLVKLNPTSAMAEGQVRAKGPVPMMLRLLPLTKPLLARREQILADDGRPDLLTAAR